MFNLIKILAVFFLICTSTIYGQTCDSIGGKPINCIDSAGLKQGYWELLRNKVIVSGYGGLGSEDGCRYFERVESYPLAKGEYKDNKKIGSWLYYSGNQLGSMVREITYNENGSIEDNNLADHYTLTISKDTLDVTGQLYHHLDTVNINCQNGHCTFKLANGKELIKFPFIDLNTIEYELQRTNIGIYDRKIKMEKN